MKRKPLNTTQLAALRRALRHPHGLCGGDRSTGKALVARGYAVELTTGFAITAAGRERARRAADVVGKTTFDGPRDESLMRDLEE